MWFETSELSDNFDEDPPKIIFRSPVRSSTLLKFSFKTLLPTQILCSPGRLNISRKTPLLKRYKYRLFELTQMSGNLYCATFDMYMFGHPNLRLVESICGWRPASHLLMLTYSLLF